MTPNGISLNEFTELIQSGHVTGDVIAHLDVFAEQVGVETQPVPGDVESPLQQDVSEQSAGIRCSESGSC